MDSTDTSQKIHDPARRFVILGNQRSRSTLLVQLLDQHPEVVCHGELFIPDKFVLARSMPHEGLLSRLGVSSAEDVVARDAAPVEFLHRLMSADIGKARWVGHKLLRGNVPRVHHAELTDDSVVKLVLVRNQAYCATSRLIAQHTGDWVRFAGQRARAGRVDVDPGALLRLALAHEQHLDTVLSHLQAAGHRFMVVFSEDVPTQEGFDSICDFLGIASAPIDTKATVQKQNSDCMDRRVRNLDQLREFLAGTPLATQLDEDRVVDRERWLGYQRDVADVELLERKLAGIQVHATLDWRLVTDRPASPTSRLRSLWLSLVGWTRDV